MYGHMNMQSAGVWNQNSSAQAHRHNLHYGQHYNQALHLQQQQTSWVHPGMMAPREAEAWDRVAFLEAENTRLYHANVQKEETLRQRGRDVDHWRAEYRDVVSHTNVAIEKYKEQLKNLSMFVASKLDGVSKAAILKAAGISYEALQALDTMPLMPPAGLAVVTKVMSTEDFKDSTDSGNDNKSLREEEKVECETKMAVGSDKDVGTVSPPLSNLVVAAGDKEDGKTAKAGEESGPESPTTPLDRAPLAAGKGDKSPCSTSGDELAPKAKANNSDDTEILDAQTAVTAALGLTAPKRPAARLSPKSPSSAAAAAELEATTITLAKSCASRAMAHLPGTGCADITPMGTTTQPMGSSTPNSNSNSSGAGKKGGKRGGKKHRKGGNKAGNKGLPCGKATTV